MIETILRRKHLESSSKVRVPSTPQWSDECVTETQHRSGLRVLMLFPLAECRQEREMIAILTVLRMFPYFQHQISVLKQRGTASLRPHAQMPLSEHLRGNSRDAANVVNNASHSSLQLSVSLNALSFLQISTWTE